MGRLEEYSDARLTALLPVPASDANKYSRGVLTLVAGSLAYPGAACLAAAAAQRAGAGYVQVVTAPENVRTVQAFRPSLVARSWEDLVGKASSLRASVPGKPCAYAVGSGFAPDDERTADLALFVLRWAEAPVLVDGGGLAAVATDEGGAVLRERAKRGLATVLTPHGGEAARLASAVGLSVPETNDASGLAGFAAALSTAYGATVALKGPDTYIAGDGRVAAVREGTPALAKAGTGDVLAGMVSALLAQSVEAFDAALLGAVLHARAAKAAEVHLTSICVNPEDVVEAIPLAVKTLL